MKTLSILLLLSLNLVFAQTNCESDPFGEGCGLNSGASTTTTLVCNDGTKFPGIQQSGPAASRAQSMCNGHGGIAAYVQDGASVGVSQNQNNIDSGTLPGGVAAAAAASASSSATTPGTTTGGSGLPDGTPCGSGGGAMDCSNCINPPPGVPCTGTCGGTCSGGTSTTTGGSTTGGTSCSSSCDCPSAYDVCEGGTCVDRTTGCRNGTLAKGDATCQWLCQGGGWTCSSPQRSCFGGTTTTGRTSTGTTTGSTSTTGGGEGCSCSPSSIQCFTGTTRCCPTGTPYSGSGFGCCATTPGGTFGQICI